MDSTRRSTLDLIELAAADVSIAERGRQLLHVVRDYVDDGDIVRAREVLCKIEPVYYEEYMYLQVIEDSLLGEAVARLVEVLGHDFWMFGRPAAQS